MKFLLRAVSAIVLTSLFGLSTMAVAAPRILVQSTTSTQNSGFYDYILPIFKKETGLDVAVVAVGTGQAIKNAMNGDADVLLVHAKAAEEKFVAQGYGLNRFDLMYNDFVLIGPKSDPDGLAKATSPTDAFQRLAKGRAGFISRGDDSGTNKKERALWAEAGLDPTSADSWYHEVGTGMGATIRTAIELRAYTLTDRATWIAYQNKMDAVILYQGDPALFNQYGIISINPVRFPKANVVDGKVFIDWLMSAHGQSLIAAYKVDGQQLFFPDARR